MMSRPPLFGIPALTRAERWLLAAVLVSLALACFGPAVALPAHYHDFADQRSVWGLPCALDVLSNLPFALAGGAGLWQLARLPAGAVPAAQRTLAALFFVGLGLTAVGSAIYHWQPQDAGLAVDRAGMSVTFAGMLGLAVAERLSARAGLALAALTLGLAWWAAMLPLLTGNMTPWAVLQAGGALLLLSLAWRRPYVTALGFSVTAVIAFYAVAKALELSDHAVFALTGGTVSGHSLKHVVAAGAAIPVWRALRRAGEAVSAGHNPVPPALARADLTSPHYKG